MSLRYLRSFLKVQLECLRLREKVRQRVYVIHVRFSEHISQFKFFEKVQYRVYGIYIFLSGLSYLHFGVKSTTSYTNFFVWIIVIQGMGNLVTLLILLTSKLDLSLSFRQLLTGLLLSDSTCIIMTVILFSLPYLTTVSPYLVPISLPIAQVALTMSVYMTIALSLERFLVVSKPQNQSSQKH